MQIMYSFLSLHFCSSNSLFTSSSVPCAISANVSSEYGAYNGLYVFTDFQLPFIYKCFSYFFSFQIYVYNNTSPSERFNLCHCIIAPIPQKHYAQKTLLYSRVYELICSCNEICFSSSKITIDSTIFVTSNLFI